MATREQINGILTILATLPNCPIQDETTRDIVESMYFAALGDIPIEYLQAAYLEYIGGDNPFFPSNPGVLRKIAFDIEMIAQGIPTPSQAWAMVLKGPAMIEARYCAKGAELRDAIDPTARDYWHKLGDYDKHIKGCDICMPTSRPGSYGSNTVDEAVRLMGGRDVIFTDNATSDRARFIDSYRELVALERRRLQMHPQVAALINDPQRPRIGTPNGEMKLLAEKMGGNP